MGGRFTSLVAGLSIVAAVQAQQTYETRPDIHGDNVVFTAEGDLWLGSISGHTVKRITSDPGTENAAHFSPDGSEIAFTGQYEGGFDVYLMPTAGGAPKRLTYDPRTPVVQGWTPDGSGVLFRSSRYNTNGVPRLFSVSPTGGMPRLLPIPSAYFGSINAEGVVAYVPISFEWANWFHYAGGGADDIWLANTKTVKFTRLTDYSGVDTTPVWCGNKIYFVSERSGWSNIWQIDPTTKALKQCTDYSSGAVRYPSSDGHRVIFQHGATLAVYDPAVDKTTELAFNLDTDRIHAREQRVALAREIGQPVLYTNTGNLNPNSAGMALGPTGKRILLAPRGQIVSVAAEAGDMRVLEKVPGTRARFPIWSPDGKRFAFLSDRSGENEIWVGDAAGGGTPTQLTHGLASNPFPPMWSPDGKWIAISDRNARVMLIDASSGAIKVVDQGPADQSYDATSSEFNFSPDGKFFAFSRMESNWNYSVNLFEIATGKRAVVTDTRVNSYAPVFDTTGKFLIYLADSNLNPASSSILGKLTYQNFTTVQMVAMAADTKSPFLPKDDEEGAAADAKDQAAKKSAETPEGTRVDWEGLAARVIAVPLPPASYAEVESLPGRILALSDGDLVSFGLDSRKAKPIVSGIQAFEKSRDNKKLMFYAGGTISVHDADAGPTTPSAGAVDLSPYTITYDPVPEWKQIFEESWHIARDFYYDPGMHGLDWNAVRAEYEPQLQYVGDRSDLSRLLVDMVSELSTGHAYIVGAPGGRGKDLGFLGIDVEPSSSMEGVRIVKMYHGDPWNPGLRSPLLEPGMNVKEGDYILEIAGQQVKSNTDIEQFLDSTPGQTVAMMVNDKPSRVGARVIRVRPLSDENALRYQDWVEGRVRYVQEHGGTNFGYAHISDMGNSGYVGFTKGHYPNPYKTAMIYDTRYNGGGYVSSMILQDIGAYPTQWFKPRYGQPWTRENWANIGYKVALCNEDDFSDGELFIEDWKRMKLGPVVGKRTGGGEVGSGGGYTLIDRGSIYVPNYGAYRDGEWMIEGKGATPTVEVDQDPNAVMAGRDPQLDKAIEILKDELAKAPISVPQHPPFKKVPARKGG